MDDTFDRRKKTLDSFFIGEWTDGIVSMVYRMINRPILRNERRYIVFDGDVDALWIENMACVVFFICIN